MTWAEAIELTGWIWARANWWVDNVTIVFVGRPGSAYGYQVRCAYGAGLL